MSNDKDNPTPLKTEADVDAGDTATTDVDVGVPAVGGLNFTPQKGRVSDDQSDTTEEGE